MISDRTAYRAEGFAMLLGRLLIAALFVPSGFGKLMHLAGFAHSLPAHGVPAAAAPILAVLGAATEFFGGLAVALGYRMRLATLVMVAFTIVATLLSHRYWEAQGAMRELQHIQFMKNLAIIGGFLILFARGAGPLSLDRSR